MLLRILDMLLRFVEFVTERLAGLFLPLIWLCGSDVAAAHATAGVSDRNLGLREVIESHSRLNSSMGVARVRSASSAAVAPCAAAFALTSPLASGAVVAVHTRYTVPPHACCT